MPIYGDYHSDFQNSNNSSWDQIQASLKILVPSYQPIPYDNLDELSFLSDQKQKRLFAEIKEACNATMEIQKSPSYQKQEDEDEFDDRNIHNGFDDWSTAVAEQKPPPESPDLTLLAVGEGEPMSTVVLAATASHKSEDVRDAVTGVHRGAEDSAVAKGKMEITDLDPGEGEDGANAATKATASEPTHIGLGRIGNNEDPTARTNRIHG
ncbi:hypothetical protein PIB30_077776 [Stylosanthes scabra]|uniref:Uncharacterized protein n=1 Tax=Stylosanthes scabra TaxID=79078 RepID=A0ABU6YPL3_9FABA|nr:hypothetical protein [Stylosanthes scabra]